MNRLMIRLLHCLIRFAARLAGHSGHHPAGRYFVDCQKSRWKANHLGAELRLVEVQAFHHPMGQTFRIYNR
jgi:hypothetical protein